MAFEQSRDFRSSAQDSKRVREHKEKWSRGSRPSSGCNLRWTDSDQTMTGSDSQQEKIRPERHFNDFRYPAQNIVKPRGSAHMRHDIPQSHWNAKAAARAELRDSNNISRSVHDLLPSPYSQRKSSISDGFLYSFDKTESPGKPLSLEIFVKTNPKETDKFVEKEYEILDNNGDAIKGRKARRNLRRKNNEPTSDDVEVLEDDGFELV